MIATFSFYLFSTILIGSALAVVLAKNPVHAVLFLILAFFNAAGLFLLNGAEFLALILVIVYVGAVAVLFLFVVMMLDINFEELRRGFARYLPLGLVVGGILLIELILVFQGFNNHLATGHVPTPNPEQISNTKALGLLIYTHYVLIFQLAGFILLVAMIGAIVLTLQHKADVRRQKVSDQVKRTRDETVRIVKVPKGGGIPLGSLGNNMGGSIGSHK